jgi:hypothetical protein
MTTPPTAFESVLLAELNVGLPPTTFWKLLNEPDDWSFVLKLHAIFEGVLGRVLMKRVTEETLDEYTNFTRRVHMAFELPFMSRDVVEGEKCRSFLLALNQLRNRFAHNASYISADLHTVLGEISHEKRRNLLRHLNLTTAFDNPRGMFDRLSPLLLKADSTVKDAKKVREACARVYPRGMIMNLATGVLDALSLGYFIELGKDGKYYLDEFRPQLQDLLNDPAVIEFRREQDFFR